MACERPVPCLSFRGNLRYLSGQPRWEVRYPGFSKRSMARLRLRETATPSCSTAQYIELRFVLKNVTGTWSVLRWRFYMRRFLLLLLPIITTKVPRKYRLQLGRQGLLHLADITP